MTVMHISVLGCVHDSFVAIFEFGPHITTVRFITHCTSLYSSDPCRCIPPPSGFPGHLSAILHPLPRLPSSWGRWGGGGARFGAPERQYRGHFAVAIARHLHRAEAVRRPSQQPSASSQQPSASYRRAFDLLGWVQCAFLFCGSAPLSSLSCLVPLSCFVQKALLAASF